MTENVTTDTVSNPEFGPRVPEATWQQQGPCPGGLTRYELGDLRQPRALARLGPQVARDGLALFDGVDDRRVLLATARTVMTIAAHPDADRDGVTTLTDLGPTGDHPGAAGFSHRALPPHTDRSGVADPPGLVMLTCAAGAFVGGESLLTDAAAVHADLARVAPDALEAFHRPRSVSFGGSAGYRGAVFTHVPGPPARCRLRLRMDELVAFSPRTQDHLPALTAAIEAHTIRLTLTTGRGYLLDNHRWLHARSAYSGARTLYRILGHPRPDLKIITGIPVQA